MSAQQQQQQQVSATSSKAPTSQQQPANQALPPRTPASKASATQPQPQLQQQASSSSNSSKPTTAQYSKSSENAVAQQQPQAHQSSSSSRPLTPLNSQRITDGAPPSAAAHKRTGQSAAHQPAPPSKKQKQSDSGALSAGGVGAANAGPKAPSSTGQIKPGLQPQPPTAAGVTCVQQLQLQQQQQQQYSTPVYAASVAQTDAARYGSLNEFTFFERVKKALRTQQVYENFLKCLALFNQGVVTRGELVALVEPFLGKFAPLYRFFKDWVENRPTAQPPQTSTLQQQQSPLSQQQQHSSQSEAAAAASATRPAAAPPLDVGSEKGAGGASASGGKMALRELCRLSVPPADEGVLMEIDYLSCKQHGASYRDISAYSLPPSSGQTELCKQVASPAQCALNNHFDAN